jgi:MerR family transcriptional regulator, copper efflux regulator
MRIGEVARSTGLTVHTLRFYERKGLLPPAARGPSNYRDFPAHSIERLAFIREAQRLGFTLSEVREFVDRRNTPLGCVQLRNTGERKLREIEAELRRLRTIRASLRKLLRRCDASTAAAPCAVSVALGDIRRT